MPAVASALSGLIINTADQYKFAASAAYRAPKPGVHPLQQKRPEFFIEICTAIGTGVVNASLGKIQFTTADSGLSGQPPVPGTGLGTGIIFDAAYFRETAYPLIRGYILADFGKTRHDPYPPGTKNSGVFLDALLHAVGDMIAQHYATAWTLISAHPMIYQGTGTINDGMYFGLVATDVQAAIEAAASNLQGRFWPRLAQGIAEVYVDTVHNHSTGTVTITGSCTSSISQVCAVPSTGTGTGNAT